MTLIDKLSKLDGPDPKIDAEICILFQYGGKNSEGATNVRTDPEWDDSDLLFEIGDEDCCNPIPKLTASIDDAVALAERVLPGWNVNLEAGSLPHMSNTYKADLFNQNGDWQHCIGEGTTPAIALCIALLRAKEVSHEICTFR